MTRPKSIWDFLGAVLIAVTLLPVIVVAVFIAGGCRSAVEYCKAVFDDFTAD